MWLNNLYGVFVSWQQIYNIINNMQYKYAILLMFYSSFDFN